MSDESAVLRLVLPVGDRDHVLGPESAAVTLVEYGNYECIYCRQLHPRIQEMMKRAEGVRLVFRHFPIRQVHPHSARAAEAAEAAAAQGRFWEMHDRLFAHQDALEPEDLVGHAEAIGLDVERFSRELAAGVHAPRVRDDVASAEASGVTGTPTFFIGDRLHYGPYDAATLGARLIEARRPPATPASVGRDGIDDPTETA